MDWLLDQAKSASPFVAVFLLIVGGSTIGVLWRSLVKSQREVTELARGQNRVMMKFTRALDKLANKVARNGR
jgi:hypothetical protein